MELRLYFTEEEMIAALEAHGHRVNIGFVKQDIPIHGSGFRNETVRSVTVNMAGKTTSLSHAFSELIRQKLLHP